MSDAPDQTDDAIPDYSAPTGPLYIGPNDDGTHDVQTSDGQVYSLPFEALTPSLQNDAVQHAARGSDSVMVASPDELPSAGHGDEATLISSPEDLPSAGNGDESILVRGPDELPDTPQTGGGPGLAGAMGNAADWLSRKSTVAIPQGPRMSLQGVDPLMAAKLGLVNVGGQAELAGAPPAISGEPPTPAPQFQTADMKAEPPQAPVPQKSAAAPAPLQMAPGTNDVLGAPKGAAAPAGGGPPPAADQTTDAQVKAAQAQEQVDADKAKAELAAGKNASTDMAAAQKDAVVKRAALDQQINDTLTRVKQINDKFMTAQIDPNHLWNSMTSSQHAMARIAMVLGGIGAGITGKDNEAVKMYDDAQNRDLAAQRYNIEHGKEASQLGTQLLGELRATGLDQRQATDATMAMIKDRMLQDDANAALAEGGPQAHAKFLAATAPLKMENAQKLATLAQSYAATANLRANTAHTNVETAQAALQQSIQRDLMAGQANLSKGYGYQQLPPDQQRALVRNAQANKMLVPGEGIAQREVQPQEQEKASDIHTANDLLNDIDQLTQHTAVDPAARKEAANKAATLKTLLPKLLTGGQARFSESMMDALDSLVDQKPGDVTTLWQPTSQAIRSSLGEVRKNFHRNLGLTPFQAIQETPR